jgi:hypothetical protein
MVEGAVEATFPAVAGAIAVAEAGTAAEVTADDNAEESGVSARDEVAHTWIKGHAPPLFCGS